MEGWGILIFVGVYLALQLWILPKFGVSTCMRGACSASVSDKTRSSTTPANAGSAGEPEGAPARPTD